MLLKEFDEPTRLLSNPLGIFYNLVEQTGPQAASELVDMAKKVKKSPTILITLLFKWSFIKQAFEERRKIRNGRQSTDQDVSGFMENEISDVIMTKL